MGAILFFWRIGGYGHDATVSAIKDYGIRKIDTAAIYGTKESIGKAIKESGIPRSEFFVTSKLWFTEMGYESGKKALQASLKALGFDYIDLYLVHMPNCPEGTKDTTKTRRETWRVLEEAYEKGTVKSVGVSNFDVRHLEELKSMKIFPHVNQIEWTIGPIEVKRMADNPGAQPQTSKLKIEYHPLQNPNRDVIKYCKENNVIIEAYSPFCAGKAIPHPEITRISEKNGRTAGQVILRWVTQHDVVPVPKTAKVERARENSQIFDFQLSAEDMAAIDSIHEESFHTLNPFKDVP